MGVGESFKFVRGPKGEPQGSLKLEERPRLETKVWNYQPPSGPDEAMEGTWMEKLQREPQKAGLIPGEALVFKRWN